MNKYLKLIADAPDLPAVPSPTRPADPGRTDSESSDASKAESANWYRGVTPNSRRPLIPYAIRSIIESIEVDARAQGWPAELLWNAGDWDGPRGLAAILDESDVIAGVTRDFIEIVKSKRSILRFQRRVS